MSVPQEKIDAQRRVFDEHFSRHLVGPEELTSLLKNYERCQRLANTLIMIRHLLPESAQRKVSTALEVMDDVRTI